MGYGFSLENANGTVVFDGTSPMYTEVDSGNCSVSTEVDNTTAYGKQGYITLPEGYSDLLIAYQLPQGVWLAINKTTITSYSGSANCVVPYKVFALMSEVSPSTDTHGLRMYGPGGELVFDSGNKVFNVMSNHTFTVDLSTKLAFNNPDNAWLVTSTGGVKGLVETGFRDINDFLVVYIIRNADNSVSSRLREHAEGPGGGFSEWHRGVCAAIRIRIT